MRWGRFDMETNHGKLAAELFLRGYNCSQSVVVAFCDVTGLTQRNAARMASSFGGGMGRMREVCGAVSGMLLVAELVQALAGKFREKEHSIICRELLHNPPSDPNPTPRTPEFYKTRPCARLVAQAADILDEYIRTHPIPEK